MSNVPGQEPRVLANVNGPRGAANCRWATPTLLLPEPLWHEAESFPWTCVRDTAPRALFTTEPCAVCDRWEPRHLAAHPETIASEGSGEMLPSVFPLVVDWFGAFRPPHETD